jgi:transposase
MVSETYTGKAFQAKWHYFTRISARPQYKAHQGVERGFRFLKDPLFFASSVFLKSPKRIAALGLIMAVWKAGL